MIKYQYAKCGNDEFISINDVDRNFINKNTFFCISCNTELIARLGNKRTRHFAHKQIVSCSGETYLHKVGKHLFYGVYTRCLRDSIPFYISYYQNAICNHYESHLNKTCKFNYFKKIDLTTYFDKISIETKCGKFVPDILLYRSCSEEKLFLEIVVSHESSEEKIESNNRIIEIIIENESDLRPIIDMHLCNIETEKIRFLNFQQKEVVGPVCMGDCMKDFDFFVINTNGRCVLQLKDLKQINKYLYYNRETIAHYCITETCQSYLQPSKYKYLIALAASMKLFIKNCFICRYHAVNESWTSEFEENASIFCKFLKTKNNSNQAASCKFFNLETKYVNEHLNEDADSIDARDIKFIALKK